MPPTKINSPENLIYVTKYNYCQVVLPTKINSLENLIYKNFQNYGIFLFTTDYATTQISITVDGDSIVTVGTSRTYTCQTATGTPIWHVGLGGITPTPYDPTLNSYNFQGVSIPIINRPPTGQMAVSTLTIAATGTLFTNNTLIGCQSTATGNFTEFYRFGIFRT